MKEYLPIFLQVLFAIGFAASALIVSVVLGRSAKTNATKDSAYECGMQPIGGAQPRFSVKFYLVAMLFILFDIEVVFMYPWAVVYRDMLKTDANLILGSMISFLGILFVWSMLSFVGILTVGYVYAIMKGALDWKR